MLNKFTLQIYPVAIAIKYAFFTWLADVYVRHFSFDSLGWHVHYLKSQVGMRHAHSNKHFHVMQLVRKRIFWAYKYTNLSVRNWCHIKYFHFWEYSIRINLKKYKNNNKNMSLQHLHYVLLLSSSSFILMETSLLENNINFTKYI